MRQRHSISFCQAALVVLAIYCTGCTGGNGRSADAREKRIPTVQVIHPGQEHVLAEVIITGNVRPDEQVLVHAREGGYVKRVLKDIGDQVKAGEVLAELEAPELTHELRQLEAEATTRRSIRDRALAARDATPALTPAQAVEEAEAAHSLAEARMATVKDRIDFLKVRAPMAGVITRRLVDPGTLVQAGTAAPNARPLFELQSIDPVRLTVPLPARDAQHATVGTPVTVTFPDMPGLRIDTTITRTSSSLDHATGTMQVEVDLHNPDGRIKPGMFAKITIRPADTEANMTLPTTAAHLEGGGQFLYVVRDGRVERVPLRKGLADKDRFQVLEPRLTGSELVIIEGRNLVSPGDSVEPINLERQ